jgi:hypothetical protein
MIREAYDFLLVCVCVVKSIMLMFGEKQIVLANRREDINVEHFCFLGGPSGVRYVWWYSERSARLNLG